MKTKHLTACLLIVAFGIIVFLTGCAHHPKPSPQFSAPSFVGLEQKMKDANDSVLAAKEIAKKVQIEGAAPGAPIMQELVSKLEESNAKWVAGQVELASKKVESQAQADQLNSVVKEKNDGLIREEKLQTKLQKATRENWFWRGLAATVLAIIAAIVLSILGFKFGWKLA